MVIAFHRHPVGEAIDRRRAVGVVADRIDEAGNRHHPPATVERLLDPPPVGVDHRRHPAAQVVFPAQRERFARHRHALARDPPEAGIGVVDPALGFADCDEAPHREVVTRRSDRAVVVFAQHRAAVPDRARATERVVAVAQDLAIGELQRDEAFARVAVVVAGARIDRSDADRLARAVVAVGDPRIATAVADLGDPAVEGQAIAGHRRAARFDPFGDAAHLAGRVEHLVADLDHGPVAALEMRDAGAVTLVAEPRRARSGPLDHMAVRVEPAALPGAVGRGVRERGRGNEALREHRRHRAAHVLADLVLADQRGAAIGGGGAIANFLHAFAEPVEPGDHRLDRSCVGGEPDGCGGEAGAARHP